MSTLRQVSHRVIVDYLYSPILICCIESYLELLKLFREMLQRKRDESAAAIDRLFHGLQKLKNTASAVSVIEEELKVQLVSAEEKKTAAEAIANEVAYNKAIVEAETEKANVMAAECARVAANATAIREDAEKDLEAAIPAVQRAMAALNSLECVLHTDPTSTIAVHKSC